MAKAPAKRLGKGLGALLPDGDFAGGNAGGNTDSAGNFRREDARDADKTGADGRNAETGGAAGKSDGTGETGGREIFIPIDRIRANPGQPRKRFDEEELAELAASIKQHGVVQPIIVDKLEENGYLIVAGERRCRAAKLAGLGEVPAVVRNYSSEKRLEIALVENIHRQDLNPIEEAAAYKQIMETSGLSQDEAASRVGKNRSTVANALRLLKLPGYMRESLEDGSLSAGHARAILSVSGPAGQEKLYREIIAGGLSVRAAENRASELGGQGSGGARKAGGSGKKAAAARDPQLRAIENRLIEKLGTKVSVSGTLKKGRVEIEFYSMDDLDRLYGLLGG
ncbi:MAG: ParB/RepB/Spo0J family partition protein [Treponema sp.]|nr:ParB/RepB/Spo0J family partition protein [Treponema sp.]